MPRLFNIAHFQNSKRDSRVAHIQVRLRVHEYCRKEENQGHVWCTKATFFVPFVVGGAMVGQFDDRRRNR